MQEEIFYFLLVFMLYFDIVELYRSDGIKVNGVDYLKSLFTGKTNMFSTDLEKFKKMITYLKVVKNQIYPEHKSLFTVLELSVQCFESDYISFQVFKEFSNKISDIQNDIDRAKDYLEKYVRKPLAGIEESIFKEKMGNLDKNELNRLIETKTIKELQNLSFDKLELEKVEIYLRYLNNLLSFLEYFDRKVFHVYNKYVEEIEEKIQ